VKKQKDPLDELGLTEKNKIFCREYIFDWNAARAYRIAYPNISEDNARIAACKLLTNINIQEYITEIQKDLEKLAGISRLKVISEHMKIAYSSIAHLHNTWIERKDFELLTNEQKDCIAEIDTKIQHKTQTEFSEGDFIPIDYTVEYVKIKLYDKQKSLDAINKMLGYDVATKIDLGLNVTQLPSINIITKSARND
jgi:phage terminase small subunit